MTAASESVSSEVSIPYDWIRYCHLLRLNPRLPYHTTKIRDYPLNVPSDMSDVAAIQCTTCYGWERIHRMFHYYDRDYILRMFHTICPVCPNEFFSCSTLRSRMFEVTESSVLRRRLRCFKVRTAVFLAWCRVFSLITSDCFHHISPSSAARRPLETWPDDSWDHTFGTCGCVWGRFRDYPSLTRCKVTTFFWHGQMFLQLFLIIVMIFFTTSSPMVGTGVIAMFSNNRQTIRCCHPILALSFCRTFSSMIDH